MSYVLADQRSQIEQINESSLSYILKTYHKDIKKHLKKHKKQYLFYSMEL